MVSVTGCNIRGQVITNYIQRKVVVKDKTEVIDLDSRRERLI
jgi:hypothetical protein